MFAFLSSRGIGRGEELLQCRTNRWFRMIDRGAHDKIIAVIKDDCAMVEGHRDGPRPLLDLLKHYFISTNSLRAIGDR